MFLLVVVVGGGLKEEEDDEVGDIHYKSIVRKYWNISTLGLLNHLLVQYPFDFSVIISCNGQIESGK